MDKSYSLPKIQAYFAKKANVIVFLYRKSHKVTYMFKMRYQEDSEILECGSKFYGRFFPERCDLSEDGKYFLYFVHGKSQRKYREKYGFWTAICKPPFVKAEKIFFHNDTWGGGGIFVNHHKIWINDGMYPHFDITKKERFMHYLIEFPEKSFFKDLDRSWKLRNDDHWRRTKNNIILVKYDNSHNFLKKRKAKIKDKIRNVECGSYELFYHDTMDPNTKQIYSLSDQDHRCLSADFTHFGHVVACVGSLVKIYRSMSEIASNAPSVTYDLHTLAEKELKRRGWGEKQA